jgi:hypothetical protein
MSIHSSELKIIYRLKRREAAFSAFGKFVGVVSALAILGVVGVIAYKKMHMKPKLEVDYLSKVYDADGNVRTGSQDTAEAAMEKGRYEKNRSIDLSRSRQEGISGPVQRVEVVDFSSTPRPPGDAESENSSGIINIEAKQDAIAAVTKEFFQSKTITEMLPLVRDARRVRPHMEDYYQRNRLDPPSWKGIGAARSTLDPGYHFAYVQVLFHDRPPSFVLVEETDKGFFVDWESSVHYCEQDWQDFQNKRPGDPKVFRLLASKTEDGAGAGGADKVTIKLKHPKDDGVLYGSFDRNDPRFRPLLEQLDSCQWEKAPVILRLCYPGPTAAPNQVQIAGVEGKGWIILDSQPHS